MKIKYIPKIIIEPIINILKKIRLTFIIKLIIIILFLALSVFIPIIFKTISKNTERIDFTEHDYKKYNEKNFKLFVEVYQFPLALIAFSLPIFMFLIALLRSINAEKLYRLNLQSFKDDYRPFVLIENINFDYNNKELIFNFINSGKHPARIIYFHIDYKEPNNINRISFYKDKDRGLTLIVLSNKTKEYKIILKHDKPDIFKNWLENDEPTILDIIIKYQGLRNEIFETKEIWKTNKDKPNFVLINSIWDNTTQP